MDDDRRHDKKYQAQQALVQRVLEGDGKASLSQRRAAFDNAVTDEPLRTLIDKVANQPTRISDADITAVKASGLTEDEIFELTVCAAIGRATRQYESALRALDEAIANRDGRHAS